MGGQLDGNHKSFNSRPGGKSHSSSISTTNKASMEGVSFAGAEHSTPVPIRPPVQLSTPKPRRQAPTPKTQSAAKKPYTGTKGTPGSWGLKSNGAGPSAASKGPRPGRPVKSLPGRATARAVAPIVTVHFVDVANKMLKELSTDSKHLSERREIIDINIFFRVFRASGGTGESETPIERGFGSTVYAGNSTGARADAWLFRACC